MKKIIPASYHRNEYNKATFEDSIVYTVTLPAATATKVTNNDAEATCTRITLATNLSAVATAIHFNGLRGNLPWSSYSKFANTNPRVTEPPIPYASLPKAGSIRLDDGVHEEVVYYGSVTWETSAWPCVGGWLNNVKRASASGGTSYAFLVATPTYGYFTNVVPVREYFFFWNRTGATLYIGYDGTVNNTPTNAITLASGGTWGVWLEPLQDIWMYSHGGGDVNISEYK